MRSLPPKAAKQDLGIPQDATGLEGRRRDHICRLHFPNDTPEKIARPALKRVKADESARAYADLALSPSTDAEQDEMDLIQVFKGAIPRTHGAPGFVGKPELRPALP